MSSRGGKPSGIGRSNASSGSRRLPPSKRNSESKEGRSGRIVGRQTAQLNIREAAAPASPSPVRGKRPSQQDRASSDAEIARNPKKRLTSWSDTDMETNSTLPNIRVFLPNAKSVKWHADLESLTTVADLMSLVEEQARVQSTPIKTRKIDWRGDVWLEDTQGNRLIDRTLKTVLLAAAERGIISLLLQDGDPDSKFSDPNMWNVTPKPGMLGDLPAGYTMDTALADHVDNALQAVFFDEHGENSRGLRLISVKLDKETIEIFDNGRGMDGSAENCIDNWGTLGGSTHRNVHHRAIGVKPPFLLPYLGKYGAGGISAAFHLGEKVTVTSKTKVSKKVASMVLATKILRQRQKDCPGERTWTTSGSFRDPTKAETQRAPKGSFTKVVISELKKEYKNDVDKHQYWTVDMMCQLLKDIYYPYIQSEEGESSQTNTPVRFKVNGKNLLEITECETAIFKLHTCVGEPFVFDLRMTHTTNGRSSQSTAMPMEEANARMTCQYYPKLKGKEELETVLEEVSKLNPQNKQTFENMKRVAIRWLGRLLPGGNMGVPPFMEITTNQEKKGKIRRAWGKRALLTIDTDAGFHPNQSKIELDRDQPFASALTQVGQENLVGPAMGVTIKYQRKRKEISALELVSEYLEWLKQMHNTYDEEFVFEDEGTIFVDENNDLEVLGLGKQSVVVFHTHMKDSLGDWKTDGQTPLRIKLPKGSFPGQRLDKYATVEYFISQYTDDGDVFFTFRGINVEPEKGGQFYKDGVRLGFRPQLSECQPAAILSRAKRVDEVEWKKKIEEITNRSPGHVELLNNEDTLALKYTGVFPVDSKKEEAGFTIPSFLVVVRPKKGSGLALKQGMVFPDPLKITLTTSYCTCLNGCRERRATDGHSRKLCTLEAHILTNSALKGVYEFSMTSSEASCLRLQGTYTFHFAAESDKFKDIKPAVHSLHISPSKATAKWILCNHVNDCGGLDGDHCFEKTKPVILRLHEELEQDLFLQKFDKHSNRQSFEGRKDLKLKILSLNRVSLKMEASMQCFARTIDGGRHRLAIQAIHFTNGDLEALKPSYEAVLRVCISEDPEEHADIRCQVLPGALANVQVFESDPKISPFSGGCNFKRELHPEEIIKTLTIQGLDSCGNSIEKGKKMLLRLDGLQLQDNCGLDREVDQNGCVQLGGLLKVDCPYNSGGIIEIVSGNKSFKSIGFKTVTRKLVANHDQIPQTVYVNSKLSGVCVKLVDGKGRVDTAGEGAGHSLTGDWEKGVTFPLRDGECALPDIQMPQEPGYWTGKVHLSNHASLFCTLQVELKIGVASKIVPAKMDGEVLTAACGVPFVVPFRGVDTEGNSAFLTDSMKDSIQGKVDLPCTFIWKRVHVTMRDKIPTYAAHFILHGVVGSYTIYLTDGSGQLLQEEFQALCNLQHGKIAHLVLSQSDGTKSSGWTPPSILEAPRCAKLDLAVSVVDVENNVCTSANQKVQMNIPDCSLEFKTTIVNGIGRFQHPCLQAPVGEYGAIICLEKAGQEEVEVKFVLKVVAGNYPAALRFINEDLVVTLNNEQIQYLPPLRILVESADGKLLKQSPKVGVRIAGGDAFAYESACTKEIKSPDGSTSYEIGQACVPSRAGMYMMEAFVSNFNETVNSDKRQLIVGAGPPVRAAIIQREPGAEVHKVQVRLLDSNGNECKEVDGHEIRARLDEISTTNQSGVLVRETTATISGGIADFGTLASRSAKTGLYTLHLSAVHNGNSNSSLHTLRPSQEKLLIVFENVSEEIQTQLDSNKKMLESYNACTTALQKAETEVAKVKVEIQDLEAQKLSCERHYYGMAYERTEVEKLRFACNDDILLLQDQQMGDYTEADCLRDIHRLAERKQCAAWAFLQAQKGTNFLSPGQLSESDARELIGLPVLLARVENVSLQRALSGFIGPINLLQITFRTQRGVDLLHVYNAEGKRDDKKGLTGLAREKGYITGKYRTLPLADISAFSGAVDEEQPQRPLKLEPPRLQTGQQPIGFLGFAVNLLHVRPEFLHMEIITRGPKRTVGLRASLFYKLFKNLQVYDTTRNMITAKETCRHTVPGFHGSAISLDGGAIYSNQQQEFGSQDSDYIPVQFGLLSHEERKRSSLIDTPVQRAFQRLHQLQSIDNEMDAIQNNVAEKASRLQRSEAKLREFETSLSIAKRKEQQFKNCRVLIESQINELNRARQVIDGRSRNSRGASSSNASERIRLFFI